MNERNLTAADLWDRLPLEQRDRLGRLVDDPPRAAQLLSLLSNMAATINAAERELAAGELADGGDEDGDR